MLQWFSFLGVNKKPNLLYLILIVIVTKSVFIRLVANRQVCNETVVYPGSRKHWLTDLKRLVQRHGGGFVLFAIKLTIGNQLQV
jgi:hypothetical protein